jgi:hypothetical protein
MQETPMNATRPPVVPAEPVPGRAPFIVRGEWARRVSKRGEYAVVETVSGEVMVDRGGLDRLAMALGLVVVDAKR